MFVADYVLMEYGTGRDHGGTGARRARLRVRSELRPADPARRRQDGEELPYTGDGPIVDSNPNFDGMPNREALGAIVQWLRARGQGARVGELPPARLADLAAALLGMPDPDRVLRRLRHRAGAGGGSAGAPARRRRLPAEGPLAARGRRGLGQHALPAVRRQGAPRDRHDGHLRRLVVVLPALLRRQQRPRRVGSLGSAGVDARRPVHRRRRARDPAPDVRALLHQGARGPRTCSTSRSRSRRSSPGAWSPRTARR